MRISELMSTNVATVKGETPAEDAWNLMRQRGVRDLVVVEGGKVSGVLSERDLESRGGSSLRKGAEVRELMSGRVVSVKPEMTIRQAANLMRGHTIGCLPVVDGGKVRGIVTVTDLLEVIGRGIEKPTARTERAVLSRRHGRAKT